MSRAASSTRRSSDFSEESPEQRNRPMSGGINPHFSESAILLKRYLQHRLPTDNVIESFDHWVEHELPKEIEAREIFLKTTRRKDKKNINLIVKLKFKFHSIQSPRISTSKSQDTTAPLYPSYCQIYGLDYTMNIMVTTEQWYRLDSPDDDNRLAKRYGHKLEEWKSASSKQSKIVVLTKWPCMVGSRYCVTRNMSEEERIRYGRPPEDRGGYFVLDGHQYFIPFVDKPIRDKILVYPTKDDSKREGPRKNFHFVKQTILTNKGTEQNQIAIDDKYCLVFQSSHFGRPAESSKKAMSTKSTYNNVNILHIINMLIRYSISLKNPSGVLYKILVKSLLKAAGGSYNFEPNESSTADRLIIDKKEYKDAVVKVFISAIGYLTSPEQYAEIKNYLISTVIDFHNTKYGYVEQGIFEKIQLRTKTLFEQRKKMSDVCRDGLFNNVPESRIDDKIWMLAIMTVKLLLVETKLDQPSSRDLWANKFLMSPGGTMSEHFKRLMGKSFAHFNEDVKAGNQIPDLAISLGTSRYFDDMKSILKDPNKTKKDQEKAMPVAEILEQGGPIGTMVLLGKIVSKVNHNSKDPRIRAVQPDQFHGICTVTIPDDSMAGITKFLAMTARISVKYPRENVLTHIDTEMIKTATDVIRDELYLQDYRPLLINGTYSGWTNNDIIPYVRELRRNGSISPTTSVYESTIAFEIYTNGGRVTRPLMIVEDGALKIDTDNVRDMDFYDMLHQGYAEYIGADESNYINVAQDVNALRKNNEDVANLTIQLEELGRDRQYRERRRKIRDRLRIITDAYSHCNLHPVTLFSASAAMGPYAHNNASCRATYQSKLTKQAITFETPGLHASRFALGYSTQPLVEVATAQELEGIPGGDTLLVAVLADHMNQEDAFVINSETIELGKFAYKRMIRHTSNIKETQGSERKIKLGKPDFNPASADRYAALTRDGLPAIGSYLKERDFVIGRYVEVQDASGRIIKKDKSIALGVGEQGVVHDVIYRNSGINIYVSVQLIDYRKPKVGDKFTSRYAQKTLIGEIRDAKKMPYIASGPLAGRSPDILINTHAFPTRMTIGKIFEMMLGKVAMAHGQSRDATSFEYFDEEKVGDELEKIGFDRRGLEILINPETGGQYSAFTSDKVKEEMTQVGFNAEAVDTLMKGESGKRMESRVFVGPVYYQQLPHFSQEKIQARGSEGLIDALTRQATAGKSKEGGVRCGEMEVDSLITGRGAEIVMERMMRQSDKYTATLCRRPECGEISNYDASISSYSCPLCGNREDFAIVEIPYSFKLLRQRLIGMGILITMTVKTHEEFLDDLRVRRENPEEEQNADILVDFVEDDLGDEFDS